MEKIASVGAVYLDINAPSFPIPTPADKLVGTETVGNGYEMVLGGSAVNFARFCKNLGMRTTFIGKTGRDRTRNILVNLFKEEGIAPALSETESRQTNMNVNIVSPSAQSIMLSFGDANQSLSSEDVVRELDLHKDSVDLLYLGGAFKLRDIINDLPSIVRHAKNGGIQTVLDHGRVVNTVTDEQREAVRQTAKEVDYYLPSRDEFLELWEVDSVEQGLQLFANSKTKVVVKDAENGAYAIQNGQVIHIPAFKVNAYNTVGAGDSFNAGFIKAQSDGKSLEDSIRFANATAALKISQSTFPTEKEILQLVLQK